MLNGLGGYVLGQLRQLHTGAGQHPQGLIRHALVFLHDGRAVILRHGAAALGGQQPGAAGQHLIRRALGILDEAVSTAVHGGHHLPHGVEGRFRHAGLLLLQLILRLALIVGEVDQRALRGLAHRLMLSVQLRVGAKGHAPGQQLLVRAIGVHHGHFVLGEGAGLVRADDLRTAQGFHGGQAADHRVALAHLRHADGQHDGHHCRQPLRNGRHRQAHRHHERVDDNARVHGSGFDDAHREHHHADAQHQPGQHLRQTRQLALQGRLLILGLGERVGNLAHLRAHAGIAHHGAATAVDHRGTHVHHVLPVAQGNFAACQGRFGLDHRHGFAGQCGLLHLQRRALQDAAVGGHRVTGLHMDHVAGHQLVGMHHSQPTVPHDLRGGGGHGFQRGDGVLRLAFLHNPQHTVEDHHKQDDEHIRQRFPGVDGGDTGQKRRRQQHDDHRIGQLPEEAGQQADLFALLQAVGAVLLKARCGLLAAQAFGGGVQFLQGVGCGLQIGLHGFVLLSG